MKIIISGSFDDYIPHVIGTDVSNLIEVHESAHGHGSVYIETSDEDVFDNFYSGVYVVCVDDEGYPL